MPFLWPTIYSLTRYRHDTNMAPAVWHLSNLEPAVAPDVVTFYTFKRVPRRASTTDTENHTWWRVKEQSQSIFGNLLIRLTAWLVIQRGVYLLLYLFFFLFSFGNRYGFTIKDNGNYRIGLSPVFPTSLLKNIRYWDKRLC